MEFWPLLREWLGALLILAGMPFFLAGSIGLLRFPDVLTRLHALTKADNVGLGLVISGLIIRNWSLATAAELLLIWLLVLSAGATAGHLVGAAALARRETAAVGRKARP